jgi:hypothetical protein
MDDLIDCLSADGVFDLERAAFARTRGLVAEASIRRFVILDLAERAPDGLRLTPLGKRVLKELRPCARQSSRPL